VRSAFWLLGLCFAAVGVRADEITLKNGDRLSGAIVKSDAKTLSLKTDFAGDVVVQWDAITAIQTSQALYLELKDGQVVVGTIKTMDAKFEISTKEAGELSVSKESVVAVRNDTEQTELDRLRNPRLSDFWSGLLDTGLSVTRGNSSTLAFTLSGKAARMTPRDKISVYLTSVYNNDDTTPPGRTTAHAIRGGIRGDLNVSERLFVFAFTDFEFDEFQHLDLRNVLGGGLGYHIIKTKNTQFDVFGGGSFDQEFFSAVPPVPPSTIGTPAITRRISEIVAGESLNMKLSERTTLSEAFSIYPNLENTGNYRFTFDATAATKLKTWLGWQITYSERYLSDPLPGLKKNDLLLSTGLRLTFGKGVF